jgi:hypothetical protein
MLDRSDNELTKQTPINALTVFASTNYAATGTITPGNPLGFGQFKLRLDVSPVDDAGNPIDSGAKAITEERSVWLIPVWLIIAAAAVVAFLIVLLVVWLIGRSRRKRRRLADEAYRRGLSDAAVPPPTSPGSGQGV